MHRRTTAAAGNPIGPSPRNASGSRSLIERPIPTASRSPRVEKRTMGAEVHPVVARVEQASGRRNGQKIRVRGIRVRMGRRPMTLAFPGTTYWAELPPISVVGMAMHVRGSVHASGQSIASPTLGFRVRRGRWPRGRTLHTAHRSDGTIGCPGRCGERDREHLSAATPGNRDDPAARAPNYSIAASRGSSSRNIRRSGCRCCEQNPGFAED